MSSLARSADAGLEASPRRWIQAPAFDLPVFLLGPLVTLPIVLGSLGGWRAASILGFLLAIAHYGSTLTFFFWDENRPYHRARWAAFFGGPAIIVATYSAIVYWRVPMAAQFVLFFWNTYHVALQSCGLVSIYRHRAGVTDPGQKRITNAAILSVSGFLALWNVETHREVFPAFTAVAPWLTGALRAAAGAVALASLFRLGGALRQRSLEGRAASGPELAMIATSFALFHPYLWAATSEAATFAMLLPHYVQYLGIVWLVHRRKFSSPSAAHGIGGWLPGVSASLPRLVVLLSGFSLGFLVLRVALSRLGQPQIFEVTYLSFAFVHFYLDGLFWAFKDPHVRRTVGPYLTGASSGAAARAA